jgi:hypothetical protein
MLKKVQRYRGDVQEIYGHRGQQMEGFQKDGTDRTAESSALHRSRKTSRKVAK